MKNYSMYKNKIIATAIMATALLASTVHASQDGADQKQVVARANFEGVVKFTPENANAVVPFNIVDKNVIKQMVGLLNEEDRESFALICKAGRNFIHGGNVLKFKDISYCQQQATEADLLDIIRCRNSCVEVNLQQAIKVTPQIVNTLIAYHPAVSVLSAANIDLEAKSFMGIARGMKSLAVLECGGYYVDDEVLTAIGENLKNLQQLSLGSSSTLSCLMTDAGVQALTRGCTRIKNLDLLMHVRGITSQSLVNISDLPLLETLAIDVSDRGNTTADYQENITPAIMKANTAALRLLSQKCSNLRHLTLGGGGFTDDAVLALAENCPLLETVSFLNCVSLTGTPFHELVRKCTNLKQIFFYRFYPLQRENVYAGIGTDESEILRELKRKTGGVELKILANSC